MVLLSATVNAGSVTLGWSNSPSPSVVEHRIYYGVASGTYTNYLAVPVPTSSTTVSNLVAGTRYYFTCIASDGTSEAVPSNEVNTALKPAPATGLSVIAVRDN